MKLIVLLLSVLWTSAAFAQGKPLIVGVEEQDYLPNYGWKDGSYRGTAADIWTAFAADKGYKITFKPLPIRRLYVEMLKGAVDVKFPDSPEWAADIKKGAAVVYTNPVLGLIDGVVVKSDKVGRALNSIHTLGTVGGFTVSTEWQTRIESKAVELKENARLDQLLRQVLLDRVDGAYVSVAAALYVAEKDLGQKDALVFDPSLPYRRGSYLASSVSRPDIIQDFNLWMVGHAEQIKAIRSRWGTDVKITG